MPHLRALGTMSGTSLDGVDVAEIETDGEKVFRLGATYCRPYAEAERRVLRQGAETDRRSSTGSNRRAPNHPHADSGASKDGNELYIS